MPKIEYAITQVASVTVQRSEIEEMVRDNLLSRGGEPSYDFAEHHPIFIWGERGDLTVRWVQGAVVAPEGHQWRALKPVPTRAEINKIIEDRKAKASRVA